MLSAAKASIRPTPSLRTVSTKQAVTLACLLALCAVAAFYPVSHLPFINYDDNVYVTENLNVQSGLDWETVRWAFTTYDAANWHPLTWLSHALDCQLFALDPAGPHLVNLLLHTLNVILLFWVLLRATGFAVRSAVVAALFAVHPVNVETVAWVAERKNLLSMMFFLLALGAYRWYSQRPSVRRYLLVAVLFALGLMAKPQIIMLPFVLLLWDYWPLARLAVRDSLFALRQTDDLSGEQRKANSEKRLLGEKLPLLALSFGSGIITLLAHSHGAMRPLPFSYRMANAIGSYVRYIKIAFWPSRLAVYYPHPRVALGTWNVLVAFVFLASVTWWVIAERHRRYLLVGWLWFLITLLPMIGIVQVGTQAMADRYAYLPAIGLFIMLTWAVGDWADRRNVSRALQGAVAIAFLALLTMLTHKQLSYWSDSVALWTHTLKVTHDNAIAEVDLGAALLEKGDLANAMEHFRAAALIDPMDPFSNMYLGRYAQMQNRLPEAIEDYKKVIASSWDPNLRARALSNMGHAYRALGNEAEAAKCFREAGIPGT